MNRKQMTDTLDLGVDKPPKPEKPLNCFLKPISKHILSAESRLAEHSQQGHMHMGGHLLVVYLRQENPQLTLVSSWPASWQQAWACLLHNK
jgi:hypothetical protein